MKLKNVKLKTYIALCLALVCLTAFASCKEKTPQGVGPDGALDALILQIYAGVEGEEWLSDLPAPAKVVLENDSQAQYRFGLKLSEANEGIEEAYVSCPDIQPSTYELSLIRVKEGVDADELARKMLKGTDLMKWVCTGAQNAGAAVCGDLILLVTGTNDRINKLYASFAEICGEGVSDLRMKN